MRGWTWESENVFQKAENYMLWYLILDEIYVTLAKTLQQLTNLALVKKFKLTCRQKFWSVSNAYTLEILGKFWSFGNFEFF